VRRTEGIRHSKFLVIQSNSSRSGPACHRLVSPSSSVVLDPQMDIDGDDDSAFSQDSELEEGSSYSMLTFFLFSYTQLDSMQAEATHLILRGRKKAIMRAWNYPVPNFG
jgi:hypothetical protein